MFKVKINNKHFKIDANNEHIFINDKPFATDIVTLSKSSYHLIHNNKSYNIDVLFIDEKNKSLTVLVNNNKYDIEIQDSYDLLLDKLGISNIASLTINEIKAPMPGLVLDLLVKKDQTVEKGDSIIVLEAMKMENILKSSRCGIIKNVLVKKGDTVEKDQLLVEFE